MLLKLYTTEKILSEIIDSATNPEKAKYLPWLTLIKKLIPKVEVYLSEDSDFDSSNENKVFRGYTDFQFDLQTIYQKEKEYSYLDRVIALEPGIEMAPSALFILDVDSKTAKKISLNYGVLCHSFDEAPETCPIFNEAIDICIERGVENRGWENLLLPKYVFPSNSLIFIDRYLFSSGEEFKIEGKHRWETKKVRIGYEDGINNVRDVLNQVLPLSLGKGVAFHVLLIFGKETEKLYKNADTEIEKGRANFNLIMSDLKEIKFELEKCRNYEIEIEAIALDGSGPGYKETHNRRIISNYFIIRVEHSLKPFRKTLGLYTQTLFFDWAAAKGIVRATNSDPASKTIHKTIEDVRRILIEDKKLKKPLILYSHVGEKENTENEISNPLLRYEL